MIILAALLVAAISGIHRIKIDDWLSQLFRSDSEDYKQYKAVTSASRPSNSTCSSWSGPTLMARENLEKIRDIVTDLQLVDGVRGLVSLFRRARRRSRQAAGPAVPPELPQGEAEDSSSRRSKPTRSFGESCCRKTARWL